MLTHVILATAFPLLAYVVFGLRRASRATSVDDYFVYSQQVTPSDYANTSVGYALQMAAMFLFTEWGVRYGWGALWTPVFWAVGFFLLYLLLPRFLPFHARRNLTLHQFLAERFGAPKFFQRLAASATLLGLWGTMMAEVDYTLQVYTPVLSSQGARFFLGAGFLLLGAGYIVWNGYRAEVMTERIQVPIAYLALILVILSVLPAVWLHAGPPAFVPVSILLALTFLGILVAKLLVSRRDPQALIPLVALVGLGAVSLWTRWHPSGGGVSTVLSTPLATQLTAQGGLSLFSLFIANVLWMPVDLSTWQRISSVRGEGHGLLSGLRRGTLRVMLESPFSWVLGAALGVAIQAGGFLPANANPSDAIGVFATALSSGKGLPVPSLLSQWLYPFFLVACISIMLSTVNAIVSAISFTVFRDLVPPKGAGDLPTARRWTLAIIIAGLVIYPILRFGLGANLASFLYAAYASQLALVVVVTLSLLNRHRATKAAIASIVLGLAATAVSFLLTMRSSDPAIAVLPPLFAVAGALVGYVFALEPSKRLAP